MRKQSTLLSVTALVFTGCQRTDGVALMNIGNKVGQNVHASVGRLPFPQLPVDSQNQIPIQVLQRLHADKRLAGCHFTAEMKQGILSLSGEVGDPDQKSTCLEIARQTTGVNEVEDRVELRAKEKD